MPYLHDIFLSYTNRDPVGAWVRNHFHPLLKSWLNTYWEHDPEIFIDRDLETGVRWPDALREHLLGSKIVVAVWSPPYFRSRWCLAEWQSMLNRQENLGLGRGLSRGLIFPVIFADGDLFPEEARTTQSRWDLSAYNKPYPQYRDTQEYLEFDSKIQELVQELVPLLNSAPSWQAGWPIVEPDAEPMTHLNLTRLA